MRWTSSSVVTCSLLVLGLALGGCVSAQRQSRAIARVDLGHAYLVEGDTELAIATLQEATKLDRRNVDAWHQLALALVARGANDEAEDAFKRALRLTPEDAAVNLNYAYLLQKLQRNPEAIERLEVARKDLTYRKPAMVLNNLGYAYLMEGHSDAAVAALQEAVARQPNFCAAWYNLGLAYESAQEIARGLEAMDQVVMICPDEFPEASLKAGEFLVGMGKPDEGAVYLRKVVANWPGTPLSARAKDQLALVEAP
ncbi:MAG: tetratricopeptide repeat protein [Alphaproteobacteria bacterium]|nr:tetratricopeptide repeat protein [Alphaproteobacteria bacterium]